PFPPNYFLTFLEKREENGPNGRYGLNGQEIRLFVHHAHGVHHVHRGSPSKFTKKKSGALLRRS
ncbi:MAG: hypothetical protein LWW75_02310, partial [Chlorobiales bacterium]|nr:hypothetical protein [Chlorobiales bacterium]